MSLPLADSWRLGVLARIVGGARMVLEFLAGAKSPEAWKVDWVPGEWRLELAATARDAAAAGGVSTALKRLLEGTPCRAAAALECPAAGLSRGELCAQRAPATGAPLLEAVALLVDTGTECTTFTSRGGRPVEAAPMPSKGARRREPRLSMQFSWAAGSLVAADLLSTLLPAFKTLAATIAACRVTGGVTFTQCIGLTRCMRTAAALATLATGVRATTLTELSATHAGAGGTVVQLPAAVVLRDCSEPANFLLFVNGERCVGALLGKLRQLFEAGTLLLGVQVIVALAAPAPQLRERADGTRMLEAPDLALAPLSAATTGALAKFRVATGKAGGGDAPAPPAPVSAPPPVPTPPALQPKLLQGFTGAPPQPRLLHSSSGAPLVPLQKLLPVSRAPMPSRPMPPAPVVGAPTPSTAVRSDAAQLAAMYAKYCVGGATVMKQPKRNGERKEKKTAGDIDLDELAEKDDRESFGAAETDDSMVTDDATDSDCEPDEAEVAAMERERKEEKRKRKARKLKRAQRREAKRARRAAAQLAPAESACASDSGDTEQ